MSNLRDRVLSRLRALGVFDVGGADGEFLRVQDVSPDATTPCWALIAIRRDERSGDITHVEDLGEWDSVFFAVDELLKQAGTRAVEAALALREVT